MLLKFTVLGAEEVTFKVPELIVITLAIPSIALADNCRDVPLIVVLKRLAVPLKVEVPVKVAVPADADRLPLTVRLVEMEKSALVVTLPAIKSEPKLLVPAPVIVFAAPLIVIVPVVDVKFPLTDKLPVRTGEIAVLIVPDIVKLSNEIPVPVMVLPVPVIVKVPPEAWVNEPDDMVARLPDRLMLLLEKLTNDAAIVRLLKF